MILVRAKRAAPSNLIQPGRVSTAPLRLAHSASGDGASAHGVAAFPRRPIAFLWHYIRRRPLLHPLPLAFHVRDQLRPTVEDRQDLLFFCRGQAHHHAGDSKIAVALQYVDILQRAAQRHRQRLRVTASIFRHLAEPRHELLRTARAGARRRWEYTVAVADRATRGKPESAGAWSAAGTPACAASACCEVEVGA